MYTISLGVEMFRIMQAANSAFGDYLRCYSMPAPEINCCLLAYSLGVMEGYTEVSTHSLRIR